jgi:hypothetical protein
MAFTGPIYWNGTTFPTQDGDPVHITEGQFEYICCGDDAPCSTCAGSQPDVTVVMDPVCGGSCLYAGVYEYDKFTTFGSVCRWFWKNGDATLTASFSGLTEEWEIQVARAQVDLLEGTVDLYCKCGNVTGTVSTTDSPGTGDCASCTVTMIFGA